MPATPVDAVPVSNAIFRKTKMCKFHMVGRCMRNGACAFAHSAAELEPLPVFHFTKMCPEFSETGSCARGAACTFAHKASELRAPRKGTTRGVMANDVPPAVTVPAPLVTNTTPAATALTPAERLISVQSVLAGMGVVLLQVVPSYIPFEEQSDVDAHGNISDEDLDFTSCNKLSGGWSRQSTEEGFEPGEFSRQSSESSQDSSWGLDEQVDWSKAKEVEEGPKEAKEMEGSLIDALEGHGLDYRVKNTFLQFNDQEVPLPVLRRVLSTGSCAARSS